MNCKAYVSLNDVIFNPSMFEKVHGIKNGIRKPFYTI